MKNQTLRLCLFLALIPGLGACKKNGQTLPVVEALRPSAAVQHFVPTKVTNTGGAYFESIDTICAPYLQYTTTIDYTKFGENFIYPTIDDGKIKIETSGTNSTFYNYKQHPF